MDSGCLPDNGTNVFFGSCPCSCCVVWAALVPGVDCATGGGIIPAVPLCSAVVGVRLFSADRCDSCWAGTGRLPGEAGAACMVDLLSCRAEGEAFPLVTTDVGAMGAAFLLCRVSCFTLSCWTEPEVGEAPVDAGATGLWLVRCSGWDAEA